jgi:hypothetical protein
MQKDQILPQQRIIGRPFCELCNSQMWLACIEPDEPDPNELLNARYAQMSRYGL